MTSPPPQDTLDRLTPSTRDFTLWALDCLRLPVQREDEQVYRFLTPEGHREAFNGAGSVRFTFVESDELKQGVPQRAGVEHVAPGSRMLHWLIGQLREAADPAHGVPRDDITSVAEVEGPLTSEFTATGGEVRLGACQLEPRPLLRLAYEEAAEEVAEGEGEEGAEGTDVTFRFFHFHDEGTPVDEELAGDLGLDRIRIVDEPPAAVPDNWTAWLQASRDAVERDGEEPWRARFVSASLIWCNYAEGHLVAEFGERQVELPFSGWAWRLASGKQAPPPYRCPVSDQESYHLELSEDGQVVVAHGLEVCAESGQRVPASRLETCEVTGKRALPSFFTTCPATGRRVLASCLVECAVCRQQVSPDSLERDRCPACRGLERVSKDDPRMARILGEYPRLDRWGKWRLSETETVYVLMAAGWTRRLLLVVTKDSLDMERLATAGRWRGAWRDVPPELRDEILG